MALSFTEKRKVQATIESKLTSLGETGVSFSAKRSMQKELEDAFAKLNEQIDLQPTSASMNQKLADLIAGKFNDEEPIKFLKILKDITDETQAVDPVKEPTIKYIDIKKAAESSPPDAAPSGDVVTESVTDDVVVPIEPGCDDPAAVPEGPEIVIPDDPADDVVLESSQLAKDVALYRAASQEDREKMLPGIRKGIRGLATSDDPGKDAILKCWNDINAA